MPRCSTCDNDEAPGIDQLLAIIDHSAQGDVVGLSIDTTAHAVFQTFWLLKDLLEHEMRISAFLYLSKINVDCLHFGVHPVVEDIDNLQFFVGLKDRDVAVFQIYDFVSVFNDRAGIGPEEELSLPYPDHQRALLAGRNDLIGIALVEQGNGIGSDHLIESYADGLQQGEILLALDIFDELNEHLRICVRLELDAPFDQLALQFGIILNDAIMDYGQVMRLGVVRMGIDG